MGWDALTYTDSACACCSPRCLFLCLSLPPEHIRVSPNLSGPSVVNDQENHSSQRIVPRAYQVDPSFLIQRTGHETGGPSGLVGGGRGGYAPVRVPAVQPPRYHHQSRQLPSGMGQKKVAPILQGYFNRSSPPAGRDCDPVRSH